MADQNFLKSVLSFLSDPATGNISHTRIGSIVAQIIAMVVVTRGYYLHEVPLIYLLATAAVITLNASVGKIASFWKSHQSDLVKAQTEVEKLRSDAMNYYNTASSAISQVDPSLGQKLATAGQALKESASSLQKTVEPIVEDLKKYTGPDVPEASTTGSVNSAQTTDPNIGALPKTPTSSETK